MMRFSVVILVYLVSKCVSQYSEEEISLKHNCSFMNELIVNGDWGYPKPGDIPLLNRKVIRGRRVSILEHPYVVSIRQRMSHYLTGTLVGGNLVLTVAHPLIDVPIVDLGVVAGQNYNDRGSIIYTVILLIFHEDFDPFSLNADLVLLRVHETIDFRSMAVRPVDDIYNFNSFNFQNNTYSAFVTGWGRCDLTGKEFCLPRSSAYYRDEYMDPMLRSINIEITENNPHCNLYSKLHDLKLPWGVLCLGPARQEEHTCPCLGVPGAPMVLNGALLGVLSFGVGCGFHTDLPLIYTDMRAYYQWLLEIITEFSTLEEEHFQQLFEVTKLAITVEWLTETGQYNTKDNHPENDIQPWSVDKKLALIKGNLYDVRDYYGGPEYHEEKRKNYKMYRTIITNESKQKSTIKLEELPNKYDASKDSSSDSDYDYNYDFLSTSADPYFSKKFTHSTEALVGEVNIKDEEYF